MVLCEPCDRLFGRPKDLKSHLRYSGQHADTLCIRCDRGFKFMSAKRDHVLNSKQHYICNNCPPGSKRDFPNLDSLNRHLESEHDLCSDCYIMFGSSSELAKHNASEHLWCGICRTSFDTRSNSINHQRVHAPRIVGCPGCSFTFDTDSAMLLHLETGTCPSGVDEDWVSRIAHQCYQSKKYICYDEGFDFKCPTCDVPFRFMSAVFQHAESERCGEDCNEGSLAKFLHFLHNQI